MKNCKYLQFKLINNCCASNIFIIFMFVCVCVCVFHFRKEKNIIERC